MEPQQIPNMSNVDLIEACRKAGACEDALDWLDDTGYDLQDAWDQCPNNDWRGWFVSYVNHSIQVDSHYWNVEKMAWRFTSASMGHLESLGLDHRHQPYRNIAFRGLARIHTEMCKAAIVIVNEESSHVQA